MPGFSPRNGLLLTSYQAGFVTAILILEVFISIFILIFIVFAGCSRNPIFHISLNVPPRIGAQGKPDTPAGMVFKFS
jgi:hypothetical protein